MAERKDLPIRDDGVPSYPSNAKTERTSTDEKKEIKKVTTGHVTTRKPPLSKRIAETFVEDDITSVGSYILHDVLVPALKSAISDMVTGGIEMMLFGGSKGTNTVRRGGQSYVNYSGISTGSSRGNARTMSNTSRARQDFSNLGFESRGEAENVLSHLVDLTLDYGSASVADLYDLAGVAGNFTDQKYGWYDLSSASVARDRHLYTLRLPRTVLLD